MTNLDNTPQRTINSFGISGLLQETGKVYYVSLFSTKHLGRVSDLFAAQLKTSTDNEFLLRALLLCNSFEAYLSQKQLQEQLNAPIVIECGIDEEKIVIGTCFNTIGNSEIKLEGLTERIKTQKSQNTFELYLESITKYANTTILKYQTETGRMELNSILFLKNKTDSSSRTFETVLLEKTLPEPPRVQNYIELGDLNYHELLQDDSPGIKLPASPTGEILLKVLGDKEKDISNEVQLVKGQKAKEPEEAVIKNSTYKIDDETTVIKDTTEHIENETIKVTDKGEAVKPEKKKWRSFLAEIWPFNKGEEEDTQTPNENVPGENESPIKPATEQTGEKLIYSQFKDHKQDTPSSIEEEKNTEEIFTHFSDTIKKFQSTATEIKDDVKNPKTNKWIDGMVGELISEKTRIHGLSKKLTTLIRQKEFEFKNKEKLLIEETRKRDELLRQKNFALARAKEQLTQANINLETLQQPSQRPTDDIRFKQKYTIMQKLLATAREDNLRLSNKVEEFRKQLNTLQYQVTTKSVSNTNTQGILQSKYEKTQKQIEDLKRINQQLSLNTNSIKNELEKIQTENKRLKFKLDSVQKRDQNGASTKAA
ncbi:MAG: hypothetical protein HY843_07630 [Bdellovibrio sp.]|nr:hypothetical protein [Bdellovibrio sp.]